MVYIQKYRHLDVYIGSYKPEIVGMRAVNNIAGWKVYNGDPGMHTGIHGTLTDGVRAGFVDLASNEAILRSSTICPGSFPSRAPRRSARAPP